MGGFRLVEAKYPALLFKQQLDAFVQKIFPMMRDNVKKTITPMLVSEKHAAASALHQNLGGQLLMRSQHTCSTGVGALLCTCACPGSSGAYGSLHCYSKPYLSMASSECRAGVMKPSSSTQQV